MTATRTIPFARPWITDEDRQAVLDVLHRDVLTHGPEGRQFEKEFAQFMGSEAYAVSVSSGMAALHLAYFQMGLGPGDEVIVPAQTHVATVHAVEIVGARPVFADCDATTGNINPENMERLITSKTKAISLVHFLGMPCNMDAIMATAHKHHLRVIEDCAIALGTRYKGKHVGLFGEGGCFSFYPVKHITTGEGGMFVTAHKEVAERVAKAKGFGVDRSFAERTIPGMYDVPTLGLNYRMSDINAALGRTQLRKIDEIIKRRRANFNQLQGALKHVKNIRILYAPEIHASNSNYCLSVVLEDFLRDQRNLIVGKLKECGIGTSIYYPQPVPRMAYYKKKYGYVPGAYPNAETISDHSIALPVGPHLEEANISYMGEAFKRIVEELKS